MKTFVVLTPMPVERVRVVGGQPDFGAAGRIEPTSRAALVLALGLSDDVIALAVSGRHSDDALHEALAYGAQRAISVANPNPGKVSDPIVAARLLNTAIHELAAAETFVVFCGTGAATLSPGVTDPTGAAISGLSGLEYLSGAETVKTGDNGLEIIARSGDALLTIKTSGNISLVAGISDAAIAAHTLPWAGGIISAYREGQIETMSVAIPERPALTLNQLAPTPKRDGPELLTEPPTESAAALVEMLRSRAII